MKPAGHPPRPRLVVAVANGISGDSRVQKTAVAAARAGWQVTLVGAADGTKTERSTMGPVEIIRVGMQATLRQNARTGRRFRRLVTQSGIPSKPALALRQARFRSTQRKITTTMGWMRTGESRWRSVVLRPASYGLGLLVRLRGAVHKLRVKAFNWEARRGAPTRSWRRDAPYILDLDLAFGPVIEKLRPDMVHANDIAMIGVVAQAVARMRARGERVRWLYDAHEYVQGVQWSTPIQASAYRMLERKFIHKSDAVVTVSTQMADMLQRSYRLSTPPLVVGNAPVRGVDADNGNIAQLCAKCAAWP